MLIKKNYSLKKYNTFGFDIKAAFFTEVFSEEELKEVLFSEEFKDVPKFILGGGSNVLFTGDFSGLVIKISIPGISVKEEEDKVFVEAGAGVNWHELVTFCVNSGYAGIENLSFIPGTAGAAPIQNIGAYGVELEKVFYSLKAVNRLTGETRIFNKEDSQFGYRLSIFKKELKDQYVITYITLVLSRESRLEVSYGVVKSELEKLNKDVYSIKDVSNVITSIRQSKLPDPVVLGNAGSFFKNPVVPVDKYEEIRNLYPDVSAYKSGNCMKLAAGWLIEKAGWKGKRLGDAGSHDQQSLVLVNYGNAKPADVLEFAKQVKSSVFQKFGILLEEEVNIV